MWQRIISIIIKEFIQVRRDRRTLAMVLAIPIFEITIFGYAMATNINNVPLAVWDASKTTESRDLIASFDQTEFFTVAFYADGYDEISGYIESGKAKSALVIPPDFANNLNRGETAQVQLLTDGSEPNTGIQALANANVIVQHKGVELMSAAQVSQIALPISLQPRVWYNPAMKASLFYLPGLVGIILGLMTVLLTSFSIVRERENGTIEQINVTPLRRGELIAGKLIPNIVIAYIQVGLVLVSAVFIFGMPVRGSLALLLTLTASFLMFSLGIGLLISTISRTQFQAMQASMMVLLPSILLSGFILPVESMPQPAQWIAAILPMTYFLRIVRGIVIKGVGIEYLWLDTVILTAMGLLTLIIAATRVRKTMT